MIDETRLREIEQRAEKATAEVVRDGDPPVCRKCEDEYLLTGEDEPTPYCDPCAHAAIAEISTDIPDLLAAIREARGALKEISDHLACDSPCRPFVACSCGKTEERWCAGCIARAALAGKGESDG